MAVIYIETNWKFDSAEFSADVRAARIAAELTQHEVDTMVGFKNATSNIENAHPDYHPLIGTLLVLCNLFDLDPRRYWTTE